MKEEIKLSKRAKSKFAYLLCLSFVSCSLIWVSQIFGFPFSFSCIFLSDSYEVENSLLQEKVGVQAEGSSNSSLVYNGTLHCDRSHFRTDICYMKGDIRTDSSSSSVFLYTPTNQQASFDFPPSSVVQSIEDKELQHETIKPYTRKWETSTMDTIYKLHLISKYKPLSSELHKCEISHDVPAIFFSTGGYTGNVYHEFNDGIIPLYITSRHFNKKVIFVILEYHDWWYMKYGQILSQLSDYPLIDFSADSRTHCFQEAIVGLKIHNELTIDSSIMEKNETVLDFQGLLDRAFKPQISGQDHKKKPRVVILSRSGSRAITNEHSLVALAQKIGFSVEVLKPKPETELATLYKSLSTSDVMIGVHGAAMTHFLFLRPGSMLIQVIPLGTTWAAETYYGEPAKKYGLNYIGYKIHPRESSLYYKYDKNDPVLRDPESVNRKGWEYTKKIYLDNQYVTLDLKRFKKMLVRAYAEGSVRSRRRGRVAL